MMQSFVYAIVVMLVPALGLQSPAKQRNLRTYRDSEAYKVYAALLPSNWIMGKSFAKYLVIGQETSTEDSFGCFPNLSGPWATVFENYKRGNHTPRLLSDKLHIETSYKFVSPSVLADIFSVPETQRHDMSELWGIWNRFYDRYAGSDGLITFSAVGFNRDKTKALVYVARRCGGTCGSGGYEFLVKRAGKWVRADIRARNCGWIS
ncbi:MAG: hypothetical protein ACRD4V_09500 [Candidatus Acidiferrales bacterium]